jgi:hypothetical protein
MKTTIETKVLQAALHASATKDIRHYLNGVYVNFKTATRFTCAGTDGHMLFAGIGKTDEFDTNDDLSGLSLIIPNEVIKKLDKKKPFVTFESVGDNRYILDDQIFTAIDGTFPDIGRVIPASLDSSQSAPSQYNPEYLVRAQKALNAYYSKKATQTYPLFQRGNESGIMHNGANSAQVVIMPIRDSFYDKNAGAVQPFNRDYL